MKPPAVVLCVLALSLSGCGREAPTSSAATTPPDSPFGMKPPSKDTLPDPIKKLVPSTTSATIKLSQAELNYPFDKYFSLAGQPMALTYLITALDSTPIADNEKLSRLSPDWLSTSDAFRKREISQSELPRINAKLDEYKKTHYYSIPIGGPFDNDVAIRQITLETYDFNSKSFPLGGYGTHCWNGLHLNSQQARLEIKGDIVPCKIPVSDEGVAKNIESARALNALEMQGTIFVFVSQVVDGGAQGVVTGAKIQLTNNRTHETLGVFELRPQQ